jgi:hypothetical protein
MKKYFADSKLKIAFVMLLSMFSVAVLTSCDKANRLDGTTWNGTYAYPNGYGEHKIDYTFSFTKNVVTVNEKWTNTSEYEEVEPETGTSTYKGTYTYEKSTITMIVDGWMMTGIVSKKTIDLYIGGETVTLTKK